jgi:hypothetical protein
VDHCPVAQHGQVEAVAVEGDELRAQLRNLIAERGDQFLFCPLAHVWRAKGVHRPVVGLAVRDEGSDADDRMINMFEIFRRSPRGLLRRTCRLGRGQLQTRRGRAQSLSPRR